MNIIILGPPGAGKGTQSRLLAEKLGLSYIGGGDVFRAVAETDTAVGREVKSLISKGELMSTDTAVRILFERLQLDDCRNGAVLDGCPSTIAQAQELDSRLAQEERSFDVVFYLTAPQNILLTRLETRLISRKTGRSFNSATLEVSIDKIREELDDDDELSQRPDDVPDLARKRLDIHMKHTHPLIDYYNRKGLLRKVNADREVTVVHLEIMQYIPNS